VTFTPYHSQSAVSASSTACTGGNRIRHQQRKLELRPVVYKDNGSVGVLPCDHALSFPGAAPRYIPNRAATAIQVLASIGIAARQGLEARLPMVFRARELDIAG